MVERPLATRAGEPMRLQVLVDGTCVMVYADEAWRSRARCTSIARGQLGLFVAEGEARFEGVRVRIQGK